MGIAMLVLGLGMLIGPERAVAARAVGIDVSDYQSASINWSTLKNTYGIVFGWAKCSEGTCAGACGGANFKTYAANAKAAGVLIGAYHYARYDLDPGTAGATSEANAFWSIAGPYITGGGYYIMPMLDVEASFTGQTKATISAWVNQWCITVSNSAYAAGVPGIKPCIYCSSSKAATYLDSTVTQWNTDIADWAWYPNHSIALAGAQGASAPPAGITPWSTWQFWQYDDENAAQAITTGDGDIYNGTLAQLQASKLVIGGNPPAITTQPVSQTLLAGANVTFTVGASGSVPLSYQWRFNGGNISGATASGYTKNNVQTASAGSYSVVVANTSGTATSANAVLTVHTPPTITAQPANVTTGLGLTVSFSATVTGDATLSYQWRRNGGNLTGATASTLTIANAQTTNAGTYALVVTNLYGTVTSSNALLAVFDPYITNQPQNITVAAGAPAAFSVSAVGTTPLTYSWSKAGVPLADGGNISGTGTPVLRLANVQVGDVSTYSVTVSNVNGSMVSSNALLMAAFAPAIVTQPASQQVPAASVVSLSVTVVGPGPITYQWRKDATNLANGGDISGAATASLSISNVQAGDMGNYSVVVSNTYGAVTSSNALVTLWPLVGWGRNDFIQADIPGGLISVTAIAAGLDHNLALRPDGTVAAWGAGKTNSGTIPNNGQALVPAGLTNVAAIAAGYYHSLALRADGTLAAWGAGTNNTGVSPQYGQCMVPAGLTNVITVAAGGYHSLALMPDGTVAAWGGNIYGQTNVPAGLANVVALAAGRYHSLALKVDGTVVAWGAGTNNTGSLPDYGVERRRHGSRLGLQHFRPEQCSWGIEQRGGGCGRLRL
jgi:GH25 family lysozyme M1 (1,4-beta-N-acetylmuramidase)